MDGVLAIAQSNGQGMSNVAVGDLVVYTVDPLQSVHIGASNQKPVLSGNGSNLQLNGVVGVNKAPNAAYALDVQGAINGTAFTVGGLPFSTGNFNLYQTAATSGVTEVGFSNLTAEKYELHVPFVAPAVNNAVLIMLASSNNGATWYSTGYNSIETYTSYAAASTLSGTTNNTRVTMGYLALNALIQGGHSGTYRIYQCGSSNALRVRGEYATTFSTTAWAMGNCMSIGAGTLTNVNAIKLLWTSGGFLSGSSPVSLYTIT